MWWQTNQCRLAICNKTSCTLTQQSPLHNSSSQMGPRASTPQWGQMTELRSRYWIIKGRAPLCKHFKSPPYKAPPPPPLPAFRVIERPPFSFVGVDFAGPVYIRQSNVVKSVEIVLYTCCIVRAVHLDVILDLSTPSFIRSFKRFAARRGLPVKMLSDNGKTFKDASKFIKRIMSDRTVQQTTRWNGSLTLHGGEGYLSG